MGINTDPIYSRIADIDGNCILTAAANDYNGQNINNKLVITMDDTYGGFLQRLRFKAIGTNVATVARIYICRVNDNLATAISAVAGTPTGTPSASGGTMMSGNYYAKIYAVDQFDKVAAASTETAAVAVTGPTGSVTWNWTASTGAAKYYIGVGQVTNGQTNWFESTTNSYVQTVGVSTMHEPLNEAGGNFFYGEISLPATTASATAATPDIDYPINTAIPAGAKLYVGLGTAVAAGWSVMAIGGKY